MHKTTGHWKKGLYLSLTTATLWGMLPIALKGLLDTIDSVTITWYRFFVSVILVGLLLAKKKTPTQSKMASKPSITNSFYHHYCRAL